MGSYERSAIAYDALHEIRGLDYAAGADRVTKLVRQRFPDATSLLDVACGTGRHLQHLKETFQVEGLDLSENMAACAEVNLPGVHIHRGDMRSFDLSRRFDVVTCLFSSIGYMTTEADLDRAIANMAGHLTARGVLVIEPWIHPETWFGSSARAESGELGELAVARVSRSWADGTLTTLEMHWTLGTIEEVTSFIERHELRLYDIDRYIQAFKAAGLHVDHDPIGLTGRGLFLGTAA